MIPRYKSSHKKVSDLSTQDLKSLSPGQVKDFQSFIKSGLIKDQFDLYEHQYKMLDKSLSGQNAVITSGTGSGKTEAFLLPLFAELVRESSSWEKPSDPDPHLNDWWRNEKWQTSCQKENNRGLKQSYRVSQRSHEKRDSAVRALILYPMNALVEDQISRLREALVSDEVEKWFQKNRSGNRFYFGRYTGMTPVPGSEKKKKSFDKERLEKLAKWLDNKDNLQEKINKHRQKKDLQYFYPTLNRAEMRSRWDMQDDPPDILITNYSMLSIMMMRQIDEPIFKKTREWLNKDSEHIFHLIVDELHLYRGTAGAEVAYLLRLLAYRLGLKPESPQLRILASSASLNSEKNESLNFLKDFFGVNWTKEQIIPGEIKEIENVGSDTLGIYKPATPASGEIENVGSDTLESDTSAKQFLPIELFTEYPTSKEQDKQKDFLNQLSTLLKITDPEQYVKRIVQKAFYETRNGSKIKKSLSLHALSKKVFQLSDNEQEVKALQQKARELEKVFQPSDNKQATKEAIKGLFRFISDHHNQENDPTFRFHLFFKNIEFENYIIDYAIRLFVFICFLKI